MNIPKPYRLIFMLWVPLSAIAAQPQSATIDKQAREELNITIYNNDFAVVKEKRTTELPAGLIELEYRDVATNIEPSSVMIDSDGPLQIIEQNYRYDLLGRQSLLQRYLGKKVKYRRTGASEDNVADIVREGTLLSASPEIVQFGDEIEIDPAGSIVLPRLPEGLTAEPALIWLVDNEREGNRSLETTYITGGVSWQADHTLMLNEDEGSLDFITWVTLNNESGASYSQANLKLVAGEVNRVQRDVKFNVDRRESAQRAMMQSSVPAQALHDYQLYTMPGKINLRHRESKQVSLLAAAGVKYEKLYRIENGVQFGRLQDTDEQRFDVRIVFSNIESNNLGMPLPGGIVRVFAGSTESGLEFVGENRIRHTPEGEDLSISTGKAFDIVAKRRQSMFRQVGEKSTDIGYEIEIRNQKEERVAVTVREHLYGDWSLLQQSHESYRVDSDTVDFELEIEPGSVKTLSYAVRVTR